MCDVHVMDQADAREEENEQVLYLANFTTLHSTLNLEVSASVHQLVRELASLSVQAPQLTA